MPEAAPKQSESMEDILQSIKRIIEDDGVAEPVGSATVSMAGDVLELTQAIKEDGSIAALPPLPNGPTPPPMKDPAPPAPPPEPTPPPAPVSTAPLERPLPPPAKTLQMEEGLVSDEVAHAAAAALKPIVEGGHKDFSIPHIPSSVLRNGNTVEDLVLEALKPMLKSWLDEHLPLIVQKIVEKEVKRIVTFHND